MATNAYAIEAALSGDLKKRDTKIEQNKKYEKIVFLKID